MTVQLRKPMQVESLVEGALSEDPSAYQSLEQEETEMDLATAGRVR